MAAAFKIAIVGSGPAGLSAAARAAQLGLSHVLLEKTDHLSDTIYKYQKGKHVMATPSQLVLRSDLDFEAGKREKVLGTWDEQTAHHKVNVRSERRDQGDHRREGRFHARSRPRARRSTAETVILAIGTQGNPNLCAARAATAPHPVPARRSRRICRRAYHRDRRGRRGHRECARPRRRSRAAQHRHHRQPLRRVRQRQGRQRQPPDGGRGRRPDQRAARDHAGRGRCPAS